MLLYEMDKAIGLLDVLVPLILNYKSNASRKFNLATFVGVLSHLSLTNL